jgi:hypothetical protein
MNPKTDTRIDKMVFPFLPCSSFGLFVGVNSVISSSETLNGSTSSSLSSQRASIYSHVSCNSTFTNCFRAEFSFVSYFRFRLKTFHGLISSCGDGFLDDVCFGTESNYDVSFVLCCNSIMIFLINLSIILKWIQIMLTWL